MATTDSTSRSGVSDRRRWRWIGAFLGLLTGLVDAVILSSGLGVDFRVNDFDAKWLVGAYFGLSFAVLGFLLGDVMQGRRRDRAAAATIDAQNQTIIATRARLLQSEKLAALGQLAASIAHEVRNPLGIIRSAAQGIAESLDAPGGEARKACSFITAETDRLDNVVNSLLSFARPIQPKPGRATPAELFDTALLLVGGEIARKKLVIHRAGIDALPEIEVDPDLVTQVLVDLLSNSVEATPDGGDIHLAASTIRAGVLLEVADSGPGVPDELRARIFEPFFTTKSTGTGLGLAVANYIIGAHGGRIDVGERKGGGARFTVFLPARPAAAIAA